jgi:cyclase
MPKTIRIIPRLDIKGPNLVKGLHLEGLRVLGRPEQFARYYYEAGADELIYIDVVASLYNRNSLHDIIKKTAQDIFIPLTVGGGLRTLDDICEVLRVGADKVSLNTAALKRPDIVREAARKFGSSTIVVAIEAIKQPDGSYFAYTDNGREYTGMEVVGWAKKVEDLGAGEIMLTSVDREGTGKGFDIELTRMVTSAVSIPVIAHGGAGKVEDISEVILKTDVNAVAISSLLHYDYIKQCKVDLNNSTEGNLDFIKSGSAFKIIHPASMAEIKNSLDIREINFRPAI